MREGHRVVQVHGLALSFADIIVDEHDLGSQTTEQQSIRERRPNVAHPDYSDTNGAGCVIWSLAEHSFLVKGSCETVARLRIASSHRLTNSLQYEIPFAKGDSWDRDACRIRDRVCSGSMLSLGGHNSLRRQRSSHSCRGRETSAGERSCQSFSWRWMWWTVSRLFDSCVGALFSLVGLQYFFSKAQGFGRDFNKLIVSDEFD